MEKRMCSTCREVKPLTEYSYDKKRKEYNYYCRECQRIYNKNYKRAYRETHEDYNERNRIKSRIRMNKLYKQRRKVV